MAGWPFYCTECARTQENASVYASTLYDATYLYASALARLINASGSGPVNYRDGQRLAKQSDAISFEGLILIKIFS